PASEKPLQPLSGDAPTAVGAVVGTPSYMPPEQAAGRFEEIGPASDVYGLGAILYQLLTGRAPFQGTNTQEILRQVQAGAFPRPAAVAGPVPPALEAICLKAMARRPGDRYATPQQLAQDVERWLADLGLSRAAARTRLALGPPAPRP